MGLRIRRTIAASAHVGAVLALLLVGGTPGVQAQTTLWSTGATGGGSWGTPSNWQGGAVPTGLGNAAVFALDFTPNASVTLDGNRIIGAIFSTSANPWSLDPGTGGGILTVTIIQLTGGPLTVSTPLAGVDFIKGGSGTLTLSNPDSSYSGTININAGTLNLVGSGNYSTGINTVHIASGATLDVTQLTSGLRYGGDPALRMAVNDGDLLRGTGSVNGGLKVKSGGSVYPGDNGVGTLTVDGKGLFEAGSNWIVKLSTANPGASTSNRLDFSNDLTLEAGMNLHINGSNLTFTPGQRSDYIIGMSGSGTFEIGALNLLPINFDPLLFPNLDSFTLTSDGTNLTLSVTPVPEPVCVLAVGFGVAAGIRALRRRQNPCKSQAAYQ